MAGHAAGAEHSGSWLVKGVTESSTIGGQSLVWAKNIVWGDGLTPELLRWSPLDGANPAYALSQWVLTSLE